MNTTVIRKYFGLADFENEMNFLAKQHASGLALSSLRQGRYTFEADAPATMHYQRVINRDGQADKHFIALYEDYGWTFVTRNDNVFYFRRPDDGAEGGFGLVRDSDDLSYYLKTLDDEINQKLGVLSSVLLGPLLIAFMMQGQIAWPQILLVFAIPALLALIILAPHVLRLLNDKSKLWEQFKRIGADPASDWQNRDSQSISEHKEEHSTKQKVLFLVIAALVLLAGFALGYVMMRLLF